MANFWSVRSSNELPVTGVIGDVYFVTNTRDIFISIGAGLVLLSDLLSGKGNTYVNGPQGPQGVAGPQGPGGGQQGSKGDTGNTGAQGPAGTAPSGAANLVVATPNGSSGSAALRALVVADLPPVDVGTF